MNVKVRVMAMPPAQAPQRALTNQEDPPSPPWYSWETGRVLEALSATPHGLTVADAERRLHQYGPNRLPERPPRSRWQIALDQFRSPLIYILIIAAGFSVTIGDLKDATFIAAVLFINAVIGGYQEWRAVQSSSALKRMLDLRATVRRDGEVEEIAAARIVPGDIVLLESGNRVPADIRLLSIQGLEIDESSLTGESLAVLKNTTDALGAHVPLADQTNMAFAGSLVTRGRGKGVAVATGMQTQIGQLALDVVEGGAGKAPLVERMERFSHIVALATVVAAAAIGMLGVFTGRYELPDMFMFCVALAVSAVPEGLPVAMTIALAAATTRMAKRGVIVRRLTAVEGLGSCTLVATDKTGTLTCNELTVRRIILADATCLHVSGEGFTPSGHVYRNEPEARPLLYGDSKELDALVRVGILCNEADLHRKGDAWIAHGDAVDVALLTLGRKLGRSREDALEEDPQRGRIPYEPALQYAASFHAADQGTRVYAKGAFERISRMCEPSLSPERCQDLERHVLQLAKQGFRVLAFAEGRLEHPLAADEVPPEPRNLHFLGLVGMLDPLRPGVKEAVAACQEAGIEITMVTGDHRVTALAIARDLGLACSPEQVMSGDELETLERGQWPERIRRIRVFARVAPRQKLEIVKAAQTLGHFVAVTGDGVNDAPALQAANIGVAMGKSGTDAAREAAELVLRDDNFATIVAGVEEGRVAYDNIRKVIFLLVSAGAAEVALVLLTMLAGLPLPLVAVQLLWLNLVTNGIQGVALAFEPNEGDVLQRKPRPPSQPIFDRLMLERMTISVTVMGAIGFAVFHYMTQTLGWDTERARNGLLLLMVLFENIHIGNCRSETKSAFALSPLRSPFLLIGTLSAFLLHVTAMFWPWSQKLLGTQPVTWQEGLLIFAAALSVLPAMELHKWHWNRRQRRQSTAAVAAGSLSTSRRSTPLGR